jgi:hypothetical protein
MRSSIDPRPLVFAVLLGLLFADQAQAQSLSSDAIAPQVALNVALSPSLLLPRATSSALSIASILAVPAPAAANAGAVAPGGPVERWVEARRVDRLEASLVELAHADSLVRTWGAVGALIVGGALIAGGVLVAADGEDWGGRGRAAVSIGAWSAGASLIAAGVYRLFSTTPAEDRLLRWSGLRQDRKLDVFEFARIEGELASEAEDARFNRRLSAFSSIGLVAGGAGLIGLAASSELDGHIEKDAYILGSVVMGVGAIQTAALLLTRTPAERAWKHYAEGGGGFFSQIRTSPSAAPHLAWR